MEQTVKIENMKCDGCASAVKEKFEGLTNVTEATVDLESKTAKVVGDASVSELKDALADTKYTIID
ncbi:heavy metal-associated domain protein [Enterococcus faecalis 13-SD-W-01]|nr:heavy metal-associated domain protein [Enterococcus faecalis 13-SD-W-01]